MSANTLETRQTNPVEKPESTPGFTFSPKVDIWEDAEAIHVLAEMPGVDENHVDVKLEDHLLSILGRVEPENPEGWRRSYTEYRVGNYERSFRIGPEVDPERIQALMKNGLLHLSLPKREAAKPKRIEVKAG